jgi:outer membrane protein assembly factor BamB
MGQPAVFSAGPIKVPANRTGPVRGLQLIGFLSLFLFCCFGDLATARDWSQWRGPFLNGSTDETGLPDSWSMGKNIRWTAPMPGEGGSTPIIEGDRVFVTSTDREGKDLYAICLARKTGKMLWRKAFGETTRRVNYNKDASSSAVADGERVYFIFGSGDFVACDYDGNVVWRRNLEEEFGPLSQLYIYAASPLLYRDRLYLSVLRSTRTTHMPPDRKSEQPLDSFLLCVDPATGRDIWKHDRPSDTAGIENRDSYATLIPSELTEKPEILTIGADYITGHDWETGREIWRMNYLPEDTYRQRVVPSPVVTQKLIIACKPRAGPVFAVPPGLGGKVSYDRKTWEYDGPAPDCPSPLVYQGRLYLLQDSRKVMTCLDPKSGEVIWQEKIGGEGIYHASPTGADGKIYCMNLAGEVVVLEAGDEFREVFRIQMGGKPAMSTIAVSNSCLFIRTEEALYCVSEKGEAEESEKPESK